MLLWMMAIITESRTYGPIDATCLNMLSRNSTVAVSIKNKCRFENVMKIAKSMNTSSWNGQLLFPVCGPLTCSQGFSPFLCGSCITYVPIRVCSIQPHSSYSSLLPRTRPLCMLCLHAGSWFGFNKLGDLIMLFLEFMNLCGTVWYFTTLKCAFRVYGHKPHKGTSVYGTRI
jgi:hypothetical protein